MLRQGAGAVSVAEAFSPDDDRNEQTVVRLAREAGLPACASTELSGLYGLYRTGKPRAVREGHVTRSQRGSNPRSPG